VPPVATLADQDHIERVARPDRELVRVHVETEAAIRLCVELRESDLAVDFGGVIDQDRQAAARTCQRGRAGLAQIATVGDGAVELGQVRL